MKHFYSKGGAISECRAFDEWRAMAEIRQDSNDRDSRRDGKTHET